MVKRTAARPALLALGIAVALEIAYILLFTPFVTVDMSAHLGSAAGLVDSWGSFALGNRYLEWNPLPQPDLVGLLLLALLIPSLGLAAAETLALVGYVVALSAAAMYALRSTPGSEWLVLFVLPITFSLSFLWGFLSFSYSVAIFLVLAGFLLRTEPRMPGRRTVGIAALLLLAYFTHFIGFLAGGLFVVLVLGARAVLVPQFRRVIVTRGAAAVLPAALLGLLFVVSSDSATVTSWDANPIRRLAGLVTLKSGIVTYDRLELLFCLMAAGGLWALILIAVHRRRPWRERDPDTLAVASFTVIVALVAIAAPYSVASGGYVLSQRLALFPVLGAMLWLSRQRLPESYVLAGALAAAVGAAGLAVVRYDDLRQTEEIVDDLSAITSCVRPGSTIVQGNLAYVPIGSSPFDPNSAEASRIAAARDGLDLGNSDWGIPFSLQRFQAEVNPYDRLVRSGAFVEDVPPPLDFAAFARTGSRVDYVLLWGRPRMTEETRLAPEWGRFDAELRSEYSLAQRSPLGWWELWSHGSPDCGAIASSLEPEDGRRGA
jgi:hypothetical protein